MISQKLRPDEPFSAMSPTAFTSRHISPSATLKSHVANSSGSNKPLIELSNIAPSKSLSPGQIVASVRKHASF